MHKKVPDAFASGCMIQIFSLSATSSLTISSEPVILLQELLREFLLEILKALAAVNHIFHVNGWIFADVKFVFVHGWPLGDIGCSLFIGVV